MRTLIATLIALILFAATPVAAGDFEDGLAAFKAGDHQKAVRLWKLLAEQGDARAQTLLGLMYANGEGVPEDDAKALCLYTKAAKQGVAQAQCYRGAMYAKGLGVPDDYVRGYARVSIAAARGRADGKKAKAIIAKHMTPAQIAEGQKLSRELWGKYIVPFQKK
ncbi:MAG: tetratricopeptide repeat protein [Alphaproteobacteria bacterium]